MPRKAAKPIPAKPADYANLALLEAVSVKRPQRRHRSCLPGALGLARRQAVRRLRLLRQLEFFTRHVPLPVLRDCKQLTQVHRRGSSWCSLPWVILRSLPDSLPPEKQIHARMALYPHVNMWLHRLEDAVRMVKKVDRANVGLTFNLCHALADGAEDRIPAIIEAAAPHLFVVSINGADSRPSSKSWEYLIKPLDRGSYDVGIVLAKLRAVGFSGPVGLQCYSIKAEPLEHLRGSIAAWRKLSGEDAAAGDAPAALTAEDRAAGWRMLFDGASLAGWRAYGKQGPIGPGWKAEGGLLHKLAVIPGGDIVTTESFGDFELSWEWRLAKGANNGVKYFVSDQRPAAPGHEYQMIDDDSGRWRDLPPKDKTASFYQVLPPAADKTLRPPGEWHRSRIVVQGDRVEHWLNGQMVLAYVLGSEAVKAELAASKFNKYTNFGRKIRGPIMLTDHRDEAWFRNVRQRESTAK